MPTNRFIKFRTNETQFQLLKKKSISKGFGSISDYLRYLAFHEEPLIERLAEEIHRKLRKEEQERVLEVNVPEWIQILRAELKKR